MDLIKEQKAPESDKLHQTACYAEWWNRTHGCFLITGAALRQWKRAPEGNQIPPIKKWIK